MQKLHILVELLLLYLHIKNTIYLMKGIQDVKTNL